VKILKAAPGSVQKSAYAAYKVTCATQPSGVGKGAPTGVKPAGGNTTPSVPMNKTPNNLQAPNGLVKPALTR